MATDGRLSPITKNSTSVVFFAALCLFMLACVFGPDLPVLSGEKKSRGSREGSAWKHGQAASSSTSYFLLLLLCQGIIKRDELVFRAAKRRGIPVLMMTSGGYQKKTARIIADSILNLHRQGLIEGNAAEGEGSTPLTTHMTPTSGSTGSTSTAVWGALILELTLRYLTLKH